MLLNEWQKDTRIRMENMSWPDIQHQISSGFTTVVIGVGSTEQHGPHLPEQTDALIGDYCAYAVASKLGNALQARTIMVGCSNHHLAFSGSLSIQPSTLQAIIKDYVFSLTSHGFKIIYFVPSHGGNFSPLKTVVEEINKTLQTSRVFAFSDLGLFEKSFFEVSQKFGITEEESGGHAGESETSIMMVLAHDQVHTKRFAPGFVGDMGDETFQKVIKHGMKSITQNGILGDPRKASTEHGLLYIDAIIETVYKEFNRLVAENT